MAVKRSSAFEFETAALVVADDASAKCGESIANAVGVFRWAERNDFELFGLRSLARRYKCAPIPFAQTIRQPIVDAARRRVQGGVRRVNVEASMGEAKGEVIGTSWKYPAKAAKGGVGSEKLSPHEIREIKDNRDGPACKVSR